MKISILSLPLFHLNVRDTERHGYSDRCMYDVNIKNANYHSKFIKSEEAQTKTLNKTNQGYLSHDITGDFLFYLYWLFFRWLPPTSSFVVERTSARPRSSNGHDLIDIGLSMAGGCFVARHPKGLLPFILSWHGRKIVDLFLVEMSVMWSRDQSPEKGHRPSLEVHRLSDSLRVPFGGRLSC